MLLRSELKVVKKNFAFPQDCYLVCHSSQEEKQEMEELIAPLYFQFSKFPISTSSVEELF